MDKILLLEDDVSLIDGLTYSLRRQGYEIDVVRTVAEALALLPNLSQYVLLLLDVTLPDGTGFEVCERVRAQNRLIPIIFLTASDEEVSIIRGLDSDGDDYMTKPFAIEELLARIRANVKKRMTPSGNVLEYGKLKMDTEAHTVSYGSDAIDLTKKEFDLLVYLLENRNVVISREQALDAVWGFDFYGNTNVVDVYIRYLRSKIDDVYGVKIIQTVRGSGYVIRDV